MIFSPEAVALRLFLASFLGALIGLEREFKRRGAGLQTYSLVCLGACLFGLAGIALPYLITAPGACDGLVVDVSRVVQAVALGIGFIGAGTIFKSGLEVEGLTTAAGLWLVAGIGLASGLGLYVLAISFTGLALFVLVVFGKVEQRFFKD